MALVKAPTAGFFKGFQEGFLVGLLKGLYAEGSVEDSFKGSSDRSCIRLQGSRDLSKHGLGFRV